MVRRKRKPGLIILTPAESDRAVLAAAENFVQQWIAHPRDVAKIGHDHAELIRVVLNRRVAHGEQ